MQIDITNDQAQRQFPNQVREIMDKLKASSSKDKDASVDQMKFSIEWSRRISNIDDSYSLDTILKSLHVTLRGSISRWRNSSIIQGGVPFQVVEFYKESIAKEDARRMEWESLSQVEKDKKIAENLADLSKLGGFFGCLNNSLQTKT